MNANRHNWRNVGIPSPCGCEGKSAGGQGNCNVDEKSRSLILVAQAANLKHSLPADEADRPQSVLLQFDVGLGPKDRCHHGLRLFKSR